MPGVFANRRIRVCADHPEHRFATYEITGGAWAKHRIELKKVAAGIVSRIALFHRDLQIMARLAAGEKGKDIAAEAGLAPNTISAVKKRMAIQQKPKKASIPGVSRVSTSGKKALHNFWMK